MLQFWKKSKTDNDKSSYTSSTRSITSEENFRNSSKSIVSNKVSPLSAFDDEGLFDVDESESTKERSKLPKTLHEILRDKWALGYFIQYMESKSANQYIMCWTDIDLFKKETRGKEKKIPNNALGDHDSLSVSTDCDSCTADTNSLCDYSTATISEVTSCCDTSPKINDDITVQIFKKYIAQESSCNIKCPEIIRNETLENICDTEKVLTGSCFDKVESYVYEIIEKEYFEGFLCSDHFCKYQIDVLTSGNIALDDILSNETALFYFMEFLEQENISNLLEFWIAASNFQQHLKNQKEFFDPIEAQTDAVVLYDKYFSLQAHSPLGFKDKVRCDVEQNICGENGLVLGCFDLPLKMVEQVLEKYYLKPFLTSQLFYKYLSELINTIQSNDCMIGNQNNKFHSSDTSSEKSFSTNSAFLALEINPGHNKKSKEKSTVMSIDTRELCDPDSLWKRKRNHRLSCGRITALGKFETDLEPEPDRKEFRLKNMVKKFVSLDEDKKKEEMAWQVAEMIVKDITNVTLSQERPKNS